MQILCELILTEHAVASYTISVHYVYTIQWRLNLLSREVIHRDLACWNILVGPNELLKICDFGLAKETLEYVMEYVSKNLMCKHTNE